MSNSDTEIAPGGAFKDVQAYLDEFGLDHVIIIVPRLPINEINGVEEFATIRAQDGEDEKAIFVLELCPFNTERFERELQRIITASGAN
jgi:hypothetical protein